MTDTKPTYAKGDVKNALKQHSGVGARVEVDRLSAALAASQAEGERLREERVPGGLATVVDWRRAEIEKLRHDLSIAAKMCAKHATAYTRAETAEAALAASEAEVERLREYRERGMPPDYEIDMMKLRGALENTRASRERQAVRAESAESERDEARRELKIRDKLYIDAVRERDELEAKLEAVVERLRKDVMVVLDALCLPGHVADDEWADLCLLAGRYTEPFLSGFPGYRALLDGSGECELRNWPGCGESSTGECDGCQDNPDGSGEGECHDKLATVRKLIETEEWNADFRQVLLDELKS